MLKENGTVTKVIAMRPEMWAALKNLADREQRSVTGQLRALVLEATKNG